MGQLTTLGYLISQPEESLATMETLLTNVFGINVNLEPQSINGQLVQEEAEILIQLENDKTYLYSDLYNPATSQGKFLDALFKFDYITRDAATYSQVSALLGGIDGTLIPAGSQAITINNDIFVSLVDATIGITPGATPPTTPGVTTVIFQAQTAGVIPIPMNSLNRIVQNIPGWASINNSADGTIGTDVETDQHLRYAQKYKLGVNSSGGTQSLISSFANADYIGYFNVKNNNTSSPYTDPITLKVIPAYSIYVALQIVSGTPASHAQDIGLIFYNKLTPGTPTSGSQTIIYTPPAYTYSPETYYYDTGTGITIKIAIIIPINGNYPGNLDDLIKQGILDIFNGNSNQELIRMGDIIYSKRFEGILISLGIYNIISLTIAKGAGTPSNSVQLGINEFPKITAADITILRQ